MNLLITGGCGHIGSYLVHNIYKINKIKKTYVIDNFKSTNINSLFKVNKKNKFMFFGSFNKKNEMYKNNLSCFKNILNFCIKNNAKLIHISSTSVYGKQASLVDETCERKYLKPQSPYADIKLIEENMLKKLSKKLNYVTYVT